MAINKVVYGGTTLVDLTSDTVVANKLAKGYTAHDKSGALITGTMEEVSANIYQDENGYLVLAEDGHIISMEPLSVTANGTYNAPEYTGYTPVVVNVPQLDTSDATATSSDILSGKTAYVNGSKVTGNVASKTTQTYTPGTTDQTIASGQYLSGAQTIKGDADLVAGNIKENVNIFGVTGTLKPLSTTSDATATSSDILSGKTAYVNSTKVTGSLTFQTYYTGSTTPASSLGVNGDIYLMTSGG